MKNVIKSFLCSCLFVMSVQADILDRIEYKLGRIEAQTFDLNARVTELENVENGEPSVEYSNWDGNLYPVELATGQVDLQHITGLSRFPPSQAALRIPDIESYGGIWYRNVNAESWIAVNPNSQANFIAVSTQDRSNLQDTLGVVIYFSQSGPDNWDQAGAAPLSRCAGPTLGNSLSDFQRSAKPGVTFDVDGSNAYVICQSNNIRPNETTDTDPHLSEAIVVIRSQNGGQSWGGPQIITVDDWTEHWLRFPSICANPVLDGAVYACWADWEYFVGNGNNSTIQVSTSIDAGNTWAPAQEIVVVDSSIANFAPTDAQIQISPFSSGNLYLGVKNTQVFTPYPSESQSILATSTDNGLTWSVNYNIFGTYLTNVAQDPDNLGTYIRTAPTTFDSAINPFTNELYAVAQSGSFAPPGLGGVVIAYSPDGGVTWPTIIPVNPDTLSAQAFNPTIAVNENNQVGVLYYDFRNHTAGSPALETDVWLAIYNSDLSVKLEEIRLTPVSFDIRQAMRAGLEVIGIPGGAIHYFLGDYCKLQANLNDFIACFPVTNPPYGIGASPLPTSTYQVDTRHRQDIIFAQITP